MERGGRNSGELKAPLTSCTPPRNSPGAGDKKSIHPENVVADDNSLRDPPGIGAGKARLHHSTCSREPKPQPHKP